MKIKFILFCLLIISFKSYTQDSTLKKIRIGAFFSIDKNSSSDIAQIDNTFRQYLVDYDKFNYKIGLSFEYLFNRRLAINSGVNYSNKKFTGRLFDRLAPLSLRPALSDTLETVNIEFLEIPISFRYYFLPKNFRIFTDIGIINQFDIGKSSVVRNPFVISYKLGLGIEFNIGPDTLLQISTEYNEGLTSLSDRSDYVVKNVSFGFRIAKNI